MHLYLIRHADALPAGALAPGSDPGPSAAETSDPVAADAVRPLSDLGRQQCRALAGALQRQGIRLTALVTSPLLRARQTAELLREHLPPPALDVVECPELGPAGKRKKLTEFVRDLGGHAVALVGHNPDLSIYAGWLVGGKAAQIELAKAGAALVEFDGKVRKGGGMLVWMVTPAWYQTA
jgi:phosphohistidine phosphatase